MARGEISRRFGFDGDDPGGHRIAAAVERIDRDSEGPFVYFRTGAIHTRFPEPTLNA